MRRRRSSAFIKRTGYQAAVDHERVKQYERDQAAARAQVIAELGYDPNSDQTDHDLAVERLERQRMQRWRNTLRGRGEIKEPWKIIERDGQICHICRRQVAIADIELDHLVPRSLGGSDDHDNLAVACRRCNQTRNNKPIPASSRYVVRRPSGVPW